MPTFVYRGRSLKDNTKVSGERFAYNKQALTAILRREQIQPITIREKGRELELPILRRKKVKDKEIAVFTRQLSVMLEAGLPIVQAIEAIGSQKEKVFKNVLSEVRNDVESGMTLADAMAKHPRVFNPLFTNMIAAGEASGALDTILQRISVFVEKLVKLKRALKSAAIYPSIVISVAVLIVIVLLWKVVPIFKSLFEGLGATLPLPTRIILGLSNFVSDYILFILGGLGLIFFGLRSFYASDKGRRIVDALTLKVPILGEVFRKIATARFTRTLSTLLTSGIPILEALDITAKTSGNMIIQEAILKTRKSIEAGKTISDPLGESRVFSPMVVQMVAIGEQTGELDSMLTKISDYFEEEVDATMANLLTILEPVLIVFLGVVIGTIVISMYLPLFSLISKLSKGF